MATVNDVMHALERMDEKNDEAHASITQKIEAIRIDTAVLNTRVVTQEKRCDKRGGVYAKLLVGAGLAIVGSILAVIFG